MEREVCNAITQQKLIAIVRGVEADRLIPMAEAMYAGGVRLLEITFSAKGTPSDKETAGNISMLVKHFAGRMHIGAGTVLTPEQVELVAKAGGKFIISPDANTAVIEKTKQLGLVSIPGALTPSEATLATRAGADFVKLFPISQLGASYVKALCAPLSHIRFLAVGGVNLGNIRELLKSGACGVGIGLGDADRDAIARGDLDFIEKKCASFTEALGK